MLEHLNKIWSEDSILNDNYERNLCEQAIKDPSQNLKYEKSLEGGGLSNKTLTPMTGREKAGLLLEKVWLTLGLAVPILRNKIIEAFKTVETLKGRAAVHEMHTKTSEEAYKVGVQGIRNKEITEKVAAFDKEIEGIDKQRAEIKEKHQFEKVSLEMNKKGLEKLIENRTEMDETLALIDKYSVMKKELQSLAQQYPATELSKMKQYEDFKKAESELGKNKIRLTDSERAEDRASLEAEKNGLNAKISVKENNVNLSENSVKSLENQYVDLALKKKKTLDDKENFQFAVKLKENKEVKPEKSPVDERKEILEELNLKKELKKEIPPTSIPAAKIEIPVAKAPLETEMAAKSQEVKMEAEVPKLSIKDLMLKDIKNNMGEEIHTVWKGLFDKFDANVVKSWSCNANGEFKLELNKPMRVKIPSKDEKGKKDPSSGVVLLLGVDDTGNEIRQVSGKFDKSQKDMKFDKGFTIFVKPDLALLSPSYAAMKGITFKDKGNIRLKSEKDLNYLGSWVLYVAKPFISSYGTLENGKLLVDKQRSFGNLADNWNKEGKVIQSEQDYWTK